jgi:hypothetical protein
MSDIDVFGTILGKLPKTFPDVVADGCPYCRDLVASVLRNKLLMGKPILRVSLEIEISDDQTITLVLRSAEHGDHMGDTLARVPVQLAAFPTKGHTTRIAFTEAPFYMEACVK